MSNLHEKFLQIASDRLRRLTAGLLALEEAPADAPALRETLRELHTLKGEAGVLGLEEVGALAHDLEEHLGGLRTGLEASPDLFDNALSAIDAMAALLSARPPAAEELEALRQRLRADPRRAAAPGAEESMERPRAERGGQTDRLVHVDPRRLLALSELSSDLLVFGERCRQRAAMLGELLAEVRSVAFEAPPGWLGRLTAITRDAREDAHLGPRTMRELGAQLRQLRLSPVRDLLEEYRRVVRDLARVLGKQARVEIRAAAVDLDQAVLDLLHEPLLHLVRNAVTHGIESPERRLAAQKLAEGVISLSVEQVGSTVEIRVEDDGGGIDADRVAAAAAERGHRAPAGRTTALDLIFLPGLSTAPVSEHSGRGVGLDVVRRRVEEHGGTVRVESTPGRGTRFALQLPMDLAVTPALLFVAGGSHYGVAVERVRRVMALEASSRRALGGGEGVDVEGRVLPLVYMEDILGRPCSRSTGGATLLIMQDDQQASLALAVERVIGQREVALRPLDPFLAREGLDGSTVLPDGSLALLVDPVALARGPRAARVTAPPPGQVGAAKDVLVVEDSAITRELVAEVLQNAGYSVTSARDGMEALDRVAARRPQLVVTDLEMPRMDGVELSRRLRAIQPRIPVVMLTTRGAEAERRRCLEAGVDAYLNKAEFREGRLVETVRRLLDPTT